MKLELEIGYDDLSDECKKKIEKLKKICKDLIIKYPQADKFMFEGDFNIGYPHIQAIPCRGDSAGDSNSSGTPLPKGTVVYCNSSTTDKNTQASVQC